MKKYNEKKFCFVICYNQQRYLEECLLYLKNLKIPTGYACEVLTVEGAKSIASGYNEAMETSDARYKIYLHQDTLIVNRNFLRDILMIFQEDQTIGMIGMVGAEELSKDGVMWHMPRCGNFYRLNEIKSSGIDMVKDAPKEVEVVDGFLMITSRDIRWREDILTGWDFYDVSQCLEFRRAGYKVVVPGQKKNWTIHACGIPGFWNYDKNRQIAVKNYPEIRQGKNYLRILFIHSDLISLIGLPFALEAMGHRVEIASREVYMDDNNEKDVEYVEEELEGGSYDLVMTYDFISSVAEACEKAKVKYFAWVYDSPELSIYTEHAWGEYSYISTFDRKEVERLQKYPIKHLMYMPLATEVSNFGQAVISPRDEKKYAADIAFVGRLYEKRGFEETFEENPAYLNEALQVIEEIQGKWGRDISICERASEELIDYMSSKVNSLVWNVSNISKRYYCESMRLARKANEIERISILNMLAEKYDVALYTNSKVDSRLKGVRVMPWADYLAVMPKVFHLSKINLNITSRSIESGLPQRIWDILAVGGFLLTNYQPEIEEYFEIGKDLEVYHDLQELEEKVEYYLRHEKERVRIAMNGYQKVKEQHTYEKRMEKILKIIFPEGGREQ